MVEMFLVVALVNLAFAVLTLVPLPWLFNRPSTIGVWMYAIWVSLGCFLHGINALIWGDNVRIVAPVWCDICVRFFIGLQVAIPAASLSITRKIQKIVRLRALSPTTDGRRKDQFVDIFLCLGLPLVVVGLSHIVQGHRFDLIEELGCFPSVLNTVPAYFLVLAWPLAISSISLLYCVSIACSFLRFRSELGRLMANDRSFTCHHFYRVFMLGFIDAILTAPISAFLLWFNVVKDGPVVPWPGWTYVHYNFSRIGQISSAEWKLSDRVIFSVRWNQWVCVFCAFVFLCFFGFNEEARKYYSNMFIRVIERMGLRKPVIQAESLPRIVFSSHTPDDSEQVKSRCVEFTSAAPSYPETISSYEIHG